MKDRDELTPHTPPQGVAAQLASPVPRETWEGEDQKSGVHAQEETQLDTIVRVARDARATGSATLDVLNRHDGQITELNGRVVTVEGLAVSIKAETQNQTVKLDKIERTHEVHGAKIDTMLRILDPAAPQRVREIVATELRISDRAETAAERADVRKFRLTALQSATAIIAALASAGVIGAIVQAHC